MSRRCRPGLEPRGSSLTHITATGSGKCGCVKRGKIPNEARPCCGNLVISNPTGLPLLYDTGNDKYPDTSTEYFEWESGVGGFDIYDIRLETTDPPPGYTSYYSTVTNPGGSTTQIFISPSVEDPCGQRGNYGYAPNGTNYYRKNVGVIAAKPGDVFHIEGWFMRLGDAGSFTQAYGEVGIDVLNEDWHLINTSNYDWTDNLPFDWGKLEEDYTIVDEDAKWVVPHWYILCDSEPPAIVAGRIGGMVFERIC